MAPFASSLPSQPTHSSVLSIVIPSRFTSLDIRSTFCFVSPPMIISLVISTMVHSRSFTGTVLLSCLS